MASVLANSTLASLAIPGSWPQQQFPEIDDRLNVPFLYQQQPPTLRASRNQHPGRLHVMTNVSYPATVAELLRSIDSVPFLSSDIVTPESQERSCREEKTPRDVGAGFGRRPLTRRGVGGARLGSSRGFMTRNPTPVSQTPPRPIPGELLEAESELHTESRQNSQALTPRVIWSEYIPDPLSGGSLSVRHAESSQPRSPPKPKRRYFTNAALETSGEMKPDSIQENRLSIIPNDDAPLLERLSANLRYVPSLPVMSPVEPPKAALPQESSKIPSLDHFEVAPLIPNKSKLRGRFPIKIPPKSRNCVVCNDSKSETDFPTRPAARCLHPSNTCLDCYQTWISSSLESNGHQHISCSECKEGLQYDDIKNLASAETFARYDSLTTRTVLSSIPNFLWCPSPTCTSGQVHTGSPEKFPIFTCVACSHTFCTNHPSSSVPVPPHPSESCRAYDTRIALSNRSATQIEQERESERKLTEFAKRCPGRGCGWWIEKNDGCDHMTCSKCRWEFCWLCLADFEPIRKQGNKFHKSNCKYYG